MTRALFVFGSLERAGAQLRTLEVCRELARSDGFEFDFCSLDLGPTEMATDVSAAGGSTFVVSMRSPAFFGRFSRLLRARRYDIVHTEPQFLSGLVVWLAARAGVAIRVVAVHNSVGDAGQTARKRLVRMILANRVFMWAMRWMMTRYATRIVGVSASALDSVMPGRWQRRRSSAVIYNGTDLAPFRTPEDRDGVRREFGWGPDSRIVVNIGRLSKQKNHRVILETVRLLRREDPSIRLLLIGGGKLFDEVDAMIDDLGLREAVVMTKNRADVPRLLLASDVFFFPSSWEGLPGAPLEALAAGLPVVASDIPPMREIAPSFPHAVFLAPAGDVQRHAEHLRTALAMQRDRGAAQHAFDRTPFALERAVDAYRSLYRLGADASAEPVGPVPTVSATILYTSSDASPQSGAFRCLLDMSGDVRARGFRSVLALPGPWTEDAATTDAGTTYTLPLPRLKRGRTAPAYVRDLFETGRAAVRLARIIRRERVDVVHANEILDVYAGIAARLAGVPCVWHVRADISSWPRPLRALLPRVCAALAARVVVVSNSVREEVFRREGVPTRKVEVIHDAGPDPALYHEGVDGGAVRSELRVADDGYLIVLVSKLVEPKGHELLVRAAPEVLRTFPTARFAIVGGDVEGEHHHRYAERLRRLPHDLGIDDSVMFLGFRHDVPAVMAAADIVVHCPTHPDPFPGVILQGMALGRAVIGPDSGGAREQIVDDVSGVLVPIGDPIALAAAIIELLKDADRRASLGRAAAVRVRDVFGGEVFAERLLDAYRGVGVDVPAAVDP